MIELKWKGGLIMQCACPDCGALMGKVERGLESYCKCPVCLRTCNDCLGRTTGFKTFINPKDENGKVDKKEVKKEIQKIWEDLNKK